MIATPALAQDASAAPSRATPAADQDSAGDIVVTANKIEERQRDVALSVTAIAGDKLEARKIRTFEDYAALVPGLSLQTRGAGNTRVTLRGQNAGGSGSTVAIYIDDGPVGSSTALVGGAVATADLDPFDLNRVEVLRGPQGTLYGANSEGGLIKFVTNAPDLNKLGGAVEIGGETVDHGGTTGDVRGWVNIPLVEGKLAVRGGAFYAGLPGFIDNPQLGIKDVNSGERYGFRAALLFKPSDALTIRLSGLIQKSHLGGQPAEDVVGAPDFTNPPANQLAPVTPLTQIRYVRENQDSLVNNYSGLISYDFGKVSLTSVTSYGRIAQRVGSDLSGSNVAPGFSYRDFATGFFGQNATFFLPASNDLRKWSEEARLQAKLGHLDVQAGFFFTHEDGLLAQRVNGVLLPSQAPATGPLLFAATVNSRYEEYAGFANLTYHFTPSFDIAAGIRYASNTQNATTFTPPSVFAGPGSTVTYGSQDDVVTWSVAPRWKITPDTLVYARVARGYRPGGPNVPPPGAPSNFPTSYGADKTVSYEVGVKSDLVHHLVSVDLAAFYIDWTNIQVAQLFQSLYSYTGNGGKAVSKGFEGTVTVRPLHGLDVTFNGAYTDAHLTQDAPAAGGIKGQSLPYVPDFSGSIDGQYRWSLGSRLAAYVGATGSYVGHQYTIFTPPGIVSHTPLADYGMLSLRAGLDFGRFGLTVYARNVTSTRGLEQYFSDGSPGFHGVGYVSQPRTVGIALTAKY